MNQNQQTQAEAAVGQTASSRCFAIYWTMFKIGAVGFGGGMAMMPLFQREFVDKKRWLTDEEYVQIISTTLAVPGPFGVNLAILVGHHYMGVKGAIFGLIGVITAPIFYAVAVAAVFFQYAHEPVVGSFMMGAAAAVVGLIAYAAFTLGNQMLRNVRALVVCLLAFVAVVFFKQHPLIVLAGATLLGGLTMKESRSNDS